MSNELWIQLKPKKSDYIALAKNLQIPALKLASVLENLQELYWLAADTIKIKSKLIDRDQLQIAFKGIEPGSIEVGVEPVLTLTQTPMTPSITKEISDTEKISNELTDWAENLINTDEKKALDFINDRIRTVKGRIVCFRGFYGIWGDDDWETVFIINKKTPSQLEVKLDSKFRKRIRKFIDQEIKREDTFYEGVITRMQIDGSPKFCIKAFDGKIIECNIPEKDRRNLKDLFGTSVRIEGTIRMKGYTRTFEKITGIKKMNQKSYSKINDLELAHPLDLNVDYRDDSFILTNDQYNIMIWGYDEKELNEQLYSCLLELKKEIYEEKDENLTKDALQLKQRLNYLFNFDED